MSGHRNVGTAGMTQNQGNVIGDRPCVRQSRLFRQHDSGNTMKDLMGQGHTKWDVNQQQGAYQGKAVYDHNTKDNAAIGHHQSHKSAQQEPHPLGDAQPSYGYQQQAPQEQPVNTQPTQANPKAAPARQNYHTNGRDAGFNFFTGESK